MASRIEVTNKTKFADSKASSLIKTIKEDTGLTIKKIEIIYAYNLDLSVNNQQLNKLLKELFVNQVFQEGAIGFKLALEKDFDFAVEVTYRPGVTDNIAHTAARGIEYTLGIKVNQQAVRSSILYLFNADLDYAKQTLLAEKVLCNNLIEEYKIISKINLTEPTFSIFKNTPIVEPFYNTINLDVKDEELIKISNEGMLSLSIEEMQVIRNYFQAKKIQQQRKEKQLPFLPTDVELEIFAQTWSEHCKHKIFAADIDYFDGAKNLKIKSLFKTYIKDSAAIIKKKRSDLLSLFIDNAGIVKFNEKFAYCMKVETHNSPSALDPYGGAMTGIVGVNRDIIGTGLGAYPIFNMDVFCFGAPDTNAEAVPEGLLHPRRIFRGVHRGVKDGGNESGIPTVNGSIVFDKSFLGKPLVFCGTGGIMPLEINGKASCEKYIKPGDLIVMCGGKIGKDGIHGATFSSAHLTEKSPTSAVQIGDPITQKKLLDFIICARDKSLYSGITDNGAGGLSSSVGELSEHTGGAVLDLDKCPLKYSGLAAWEIVVSEAQERMTVAVPKTNIADFLSLSKKHDVESTVIGEFNQSGFFECRYNGQYVSSIALKMLHEGLPKLCLKANWLEPEEKAINIQSDDLTGDLKQLLASPNIASKEYWVRMYDHEIGARTVGKPFVGKHSDGPADGAVLKIQPDSQEGLIITHGIIPRYSLIDTYHMAACAIDEAVRSAIILGADPVTLVGLDNFCWPDPVESEHTPDGRFKLAQLVRACQAVYDLTIKYNCPCISGKDSMKNDYRRADKKISILPTLLFTVTGKISDISKMTSMYFKKNDSYVYLLGKTLNHLGASEYYSLKNLRGGFVPKVEADQAVQLYNNIHQAVNEKLLLSAHDLSDGGLAIALAESAFSGEVGVEIDLANLKCNSTELSLEEKLFSESPSRVLVSVDAQNKRKFEAFFTKDQALLLGKTTTDKRIKIYNNTKLLINEDLLALKKIWQEALVF